MGEKTAGKYMIKRVYKEESDKRKTIDKIASLSEQIYKNSDDDITKKLALEINRTAGTLKE